MVLGVFEIRGLNPACCSMHILSH